MAETKTAKNITNWVDSAGVEILHLKSLNAKIVNDPLCGGDALANLNAGAPFCSRAVDRLFEEYLLHSEGQGACFCVHDKWGDGKSTTVGVVARGRHPQGPQRFLVVSPTAGRTSGSAWLKSIKLKFGIADETPSDVLADLFEKALMNDDTPTGDKFRVDVKGERRHTCTDNGKPLLILEDLNPDFFSGDAKGFYEDTPLGRLQMEEAKTQFGDDAFDFLNALGTNCLNHGWVSIVTTMHPRLAKFLHKAINFGSKFKIPASLMKEGYMYFPNTFDFDEHFEGLWNDASKMEFLLQLFPGSADAINELFLKNQNGCIRSYCHYLSKMNKAKTAVGMVHAIQQSEGEDGNCCSFISDAFR